ERKDGGDEYERPEPGAARFAEADGEAEKAGDGGRVNLGPKHDRVEEAEPGGEQAGEVQHRHLERCRQWGAGEQGEVDEQGGEPEREAAETTTPAQRLRIGHFAAERTEHTDRKDQIVRYIEHSADRPPAHRRQV